MSLILIQPEPGAPLDQVAAASLTRLDGVLDTVHEHTTWVEYRRRGRLVHRSADVRIKHWPGLPPALGQLPRAPGGVSRIGEFRRVLAQSPDGLLYANTAALCTQFKRDVLDGLHAFGASVIRAGTTKDSFKMALYLVTATRGAGDTVYNTTGELAGTGNYTQGGAAVTNGTDPTNDGTAGIWTPTASVTWTALTSSGAFDAALLYNDTSASKLAVGVYTFSSQSISAGDFSLTMPAHAAATALVRYA